MKLILFCISVYLVSILSLYPQQSKYEFYIPNTIKVDLSCEIIGDNMHFLFDIKNESAYDLCFAVSKNWQSDSLYCFSNDTSTIIFLGDYVDYMNDVRYIPFDQIKATDILKKSIVISNNINRALFFKLSYCRCKKNKIRKINETIMIDKYYYQKHEKGKIFEIK